MIGPLAKKSLRTTGLTISSLNSNTNKTKRLDLLKMNIFISIIMKIYSPVMYRNSPHWFEFLWLKGGI